jgi:glycosyltransferase involved in cell wall biosynthesis
VPSRRETPPIVLFLGRLVPIKGADVLAEAAVRMREPARIVVAGDGPLRDRLERLARADRRITLVGELRASDRDRWLSRASVVVVPSRRLPDGRTEGMPLAALEAMAAGVPVVASAVGGLREVPVAAHVTPEDPHALACALDRMLADPAPDVSVAREFARQRDWSVVGPRLC